MTRVLFNASMLLATGGVSTLAIALITAGHIESIPTILGSTIAALVVWQTLSVTIAKMGLDAYLFAVADRHSANSLHALPKNYLRHVALVAFGAGATAHFGGGMGWSGWVVICISTILDVLAIVRTAELTGQGRLGDVIVASLLRLPLFLLLLVLLSIWYSPLTEFAVMPLYAASAATRWGWIHVRTRGLDRTTRINVALTSTISQQVANFLMFRGDQLLASTVLASSGQLAQFFFLSKFSEIVSIGAATAGGALFPAAAARWARLERKRFWGETAVLLISLSIICSAFVATYQLLWHGPRVSLTMLALVATASVLSWPVNYLTYRLMKDGHILLVVESCAVGVAAGAIVLVVLYYTNLEQQLFLGVLPISLLVFVGWSAARRRKSS
jgi:hypothetical protein